MPVGLAIGGIAATVGAAAIGSSASKSAANKATSATTAAADRSAAVVERNYDRSAAALQPWQNSGLEANRAVNSLLGLGGGQQSLPAQQPNAMAPYYDGGQQPYAGGQYDAPFVNQPGSDWREMLARYNAQQAGQPMPGAQPQAQPAQQAQTQQQNYQGAFDNFRNSTGYQFRLGEGQRAINSGYAGSGTLQSGAAMKAITEHGQNFASNEFGNYLGALGNQQSLGLTAAQAQAGVGGNSSNSLANIYQNQGDNLANAALLNGQNQAGLANSLGVGVAGILGRAGSSPQPVQYAQNALGGSPLRLW